jgi:hypothetical protein
MDDNAKRIGSAVFTTIIVIIWIALRAERCNRQNSYDYSYTPSYPAYDPYSAAKTDYDSQLDRTKRLLEDLSTQDAAWEPAITNIDPIAIAANPKNTQCQALDEVVEQAATWKIGVSDTVLADDSTETEVKSPFPLYVTNEDDGLPHLSPETIARSHDLIEKIVDGTVASVPKLVTRDLVIEIAAMPKPAKGQKRIKGAPAPGKPIARGWIYDHKTQRVVCAGMVALPNPKAGDNALRIDDKQLAKLVDTLPSALKTTPLPDVEAN